jgi:hypothetical protein
MNYLAQLELQLCDFQMVMDKHIYKNLQFSLGFNIFFALFD